MKNQPNRLGLYADVRQILDAALAAGGGTFTLPTHGAAVHWRQRAYKFRKLFAETVATSRMSDYDRLTMPRIPPDSSTVIIRIRQVPGVFQPTGEATPIETGDELFDLATKLHDQIEQGDL